jgi:hypothetical protein
MEHKPIMASLDQPLCSEAGVGEDCRVFTAVLVTVQAPAGMMRIVIPIEIVKGSWYSNEEVEIATITFFALTYIEQTLY